MAAPIRSMMPSRLKCCSCLFENIASKKHPLAWCRVVTDVIGSFKTSERRHASYTGDNINTQHIDRTPAVNHNVSDSGQSSTLQRAVFQCKDEQVMRMLMKPDQPPDPRLLRVAIIGTPNAGKSTLTNRLMGWKVSAVSKKVHTTRRNTMAVLTHDNTQIVFMDTPGMVQSSKGRRHRLDRNMVTDPGHSLETADLVGVIVDVSNKWTSNSIDPVILETLHLHPHIPSVLILNKVDGIAKKEMLLQITRSLTEGVVGGVEIKISTKTKPRAKKRDLEKFFSKMENLSEKGSAEDQTLSDNGENLKSFPSVTKDSDTDNRHILPLAYRDRDNTGDKDSDNRMVQIHKKIQDKSGWPNFSRVFMVSALSGDGIDNLKHFLIDSATPRDWDFHSSVVTDQNPMHLAQMCVWEKLLEYLPKDVPYKLYPEVVMWDNDNDDCLNIAMDISTAVHRHKMVLLGRGGLTIQRIVAEAKQELMNAFRCEVRLKLMVKYRK